MRLLVFFSDRISFKEWRQSGIVRRELAIYRELQKIGVTISFITYGDHEDWQYADGWPKEQIHSNRWGLSLDLYRKLIPFLHMGVMWSSDIFKTNQMDGALVPHKASKLWKKPLIARGGYLWSELLGDKKGYDSESCRRAVETERVVWNDADRIVATTDGIKKKIAARNSNWESKTVVLPNFVDESSFIPMNLPKKTDLIFIGRLSKEKNLDMLLKVVSKNGWSLRIIGGGEEGDRLKSEWGEMEGRVEWMGKIRSENLPLLINEAKIFILPSLYEGHPKVIIEAMACSACVVGSQVRGIEDLIVHDETGQLFPLNESSMESTIRQLLENDAHRESLGAKASEFALQNFSVSKIAENEKALLEEVLRES